MKALSNFIYKRPAVIHGCKFDIKVLKKDMDLCKITTPLRMHEQNKNASPMLDNVALKEEE